jgi:hypothetical protein
LAAGCGLAACQARLSVKQTEESTLPAADVNKNLASVPGTQNNKDAVAALPSAVEKKMAASCFCFTKRYCPKIQPGRFFCP